MANFKGPLDYVDVATRIVEFRDKYPDGRLRQKDIQFIDFAGKSWVVFTAEAWRAADDPAPAHGTAWEPVPGPTQFTRDSELQNAETAAWGRAMVAALAVDTRKGIASSEEVRNRQVDAPTPTPTPVSPVLVNEWLEAINGSATVAQLQAAWEGAGKAGVTRDPRIVKAKDDRKAALANA